MFLRRFLTEPHPYRAQRFYPAVVGFFLLTSLVILALGNAPASSQIDPGEMPVQIFEILDISGQRLGRIVVTLEDGLGFAAEQEHWLVNERSLLEIADLESLELALWAQGSWRDPWILDALDWRPHAPVVEWRHPTAVQWTSHSASHPPQVPGGVYFGDLNVGGVTIQYSREGSSLTWYKLTPGPYMLLDEGVVFRRQAETPESGSWWHGELF